MMPPGFKKAIDLQELADNTSREIEVENMALLLHRRGDKVYATGVYCPHEEVRLDPRNCFGDIIVCKAHGYQCNVKTGACFQEPDLKLNTFPTVIEDGFVWVKFI